MREFKFRAWDKEKHVMDYDIMYCNDWECIETDCERSKINLMQYIGLTDCTNQDMYEKDILMDIHDGSIWVVKYFDKYASFGICGIRNDSNSAIMFQIDVKDYKVIGNIYENPELLEE